MKRLIKADIICKEIQTNKNIINKYIKQYPGLRHVRTQSNNKGILLDDNGTFVAIVQWDIISKFIVALEVNPIYRNKGIGEYLIKQSILNGITKLSVNKNNINAINLYYKLKYKKFKEDDNMLYMIYKNEY